MIFLLPLQLQVVKFESVSSSYFQAVLVSIGAQLLILRYESCRNIDLSQLARCVRLEELNIDFNCSIKANPIQLLGEALLPGLKSRTCYSFVWINVSLVRTSQNYAEESHSALLSHWHPWGNSFLIWIDINVPDLWPNLKEIDLSYVKELTIEKMRSIIFTMSNLKFFSIPYMLVDWGDREQVKLANKLKDELILKNISLYFDDELSGCLFKPADREWRVRRRY